MIPDPGIEIMRELAARREAAAAAGERGSEVASDGWRYLKGGRVRHLTETSVRDFEQGTAAGLTGRDSRCGLFGVDNAWLGTGGQAEYEHLGALPECRNCAARRDVP